LGGEDKKKGLSPITGKLGFFNKQWQAPKAKHEPLALLNYSLSLRGPDIDSGKSRSFYGFRSYETHTRMYLMDV
jgi:hypothetical protein